MTLQKQFPFILTGAMSAISVVTLPAMLPTMFTATPMMKYGTQLGVAIGGGMLVEMFMRRSGHGMVWAITGSAVVLADMLQRYVLRGMFGLAGMGEDDVYYDPETGEMLVASGEDEGVEAFPDEGYGNGGYGGAGISAFPNESSTY